MLQGDVFPDFGSLGGGGGDLETVIGALLTYVLICAVLMLIVCGIVWAIATHLSAYQASARAKAGVLIALGAAILAGGGITWANFLIGVGGTL